MHARTSAHLRTLMQRFSAACYSCTRSSSAKAACALVACATRAGAHAQAVRTLALLVHLRKLTQRACSRTHTFARKRMLTHAHVSAAAHLTQCARSLSVPVAHATCVAGPDVAAATVFPLSRDRTAFSTFYLTHNQTPVDPALKEVCVLLALSSAVSPRAPSTGSCRRKRVSGVV
jgi:hypothetical protein